MKTLLLGKMPLVVMLVGSMSCIGVSDAAEKIVWRTDYQKALAESKKTRKPVFIDFYTDWCSGCQYFDNTTAKDAEFIKESKKWVMVKLNPEKSAENTRIAAKYQVTGFPTLIFADSKGKVLDYSAGIGASAWKKWLAPKLSNAKKKFR